MKLSTILRTVANALRAYVEPEGGTVEIFGTQQDALSKLASGPERWRCLVGWDGGNPQGEFGSVDLMRLQIIIQAPRGLPDHDAREDRDLLVIDRVDFVMRTVRGFRFFGDEALTEPHDRIDPCHGVTPKGPVQWLGDPGSLNPTRDAVLNFEIRRALPVAVEIKVPILTDE